MLIGRESELAGLAGFLSAARTSSGAMVVLTGEPGIGKTSVAEAAAEQARAAGMAAVRGRASSTGPAIPFRPLAEALLSLARTEPSPDDELLAPYLPALGRLVPDWAQPEPRETSLLVLAEAILRLTSWFGRGRGCLLVVDDLHWADRETLTVLDYLASNLREQPVLVLATVRVGASAGAELVKTLAQRGDATLVELDRLDRAGVTGLVASILGCPPGEVSASAVEHLYSQSRGNPFAAAELTRYAVSMKDLVRRPAGWHLVGGKRKRVPLSLVQAVEQRALQLGPDGMRLLSVAAIVGRTFPLPVVQRCVGLDDRTLLSHVRAAVAERLLTGGDGTPGWYSFEHPLTEEALLSLTTAADQVTLSGQVAQAIAELYPGLPGSWCHLAADLHRRGGDLPAAARLYLETARRALHAGGPATAVAVLDNALDLLSEENRWHALRGELLEALLTALAEDGQFDRAAEVAAELRLGNPLWDTESQVRQQVRMAWAAQVAGRWEDGVRQVAAARALLPPEASEADTAVIDVVDAYLTSCRTGADADHVSRSEALARRAIRGVDPDGDPETACKAWYAIGFSTRGRSLAESDEGYRRTLALGTEHQLTTWRNHGLIGLGANAWLAEGDASALEYAYRETLRSGCITLASNVYANLAYAAVLRADYDQAEQILTASLAECGRLRLHSVIRYALMLRAVLAAHRGRCQEMRAALREFRAAGGENSREAPLTKGLAELFCALLTEDREGARTLSAELMAEYGGLEAYFHFSGTFGLVHLLGAVDGTGDPAEVERAARAQVGRMRWNRQFLGFARAVHHGRAGRPDAAEQEMDTAVAASSVFPTARHLALRLVSEAALADSWGKPGQWLADAENHFHGSIDVLASACRSLLRRMGTPVRYHSSGTERIPPKLRGIGVTRREFEVLQLMPERLGNRALSQRMHISVRTVEKHVASLLAKTQAPDRTTLCEYATAVLGDSAPG
ncbi:helix-turn-helix transcriptional regulator [Amycolatopsis sp. NPDC003676]